MLLRNWKVRKLIEVAAKRFSEEQLKKALEEMNEIQLLARDCIGVLHTSGNRAVRTKKIAATWTEILRIYESNF